MVKTISSVVFWVTTEIRVDTELYCALNWFWFYLKFGPICIIFGQKLSYLKGTITKWYPDTLFGSNSNQRKNRVKYC